MPLIPIFICGVCVVGLLAAERSNRPEGVWLFKPVAAGTYLWAAWIWGAADSPYGRWLLLGLTFCWCGDVLLIPRQKGAWFRAGVLAFLAGHLAYITAFLHLPIGLRGLVVGNLLAAALALFVWTWLGPRLTADYRTLVAVYVIVICAMLVAACAAGDGVDRASIALGATLFALSDVAVARDRFVARSFVNRAWGLPLYFTAQLILASSVSV